MKTKYTTPEVEIVILGTMDVIKTSEFGPATPLPEEPLDI